MSQAITTVEELPAELRAELVAKREAGTTLAELKKAYPHVAPDVIRAVLPPLPKPTEPEATSGARKARAVKPAQTATTRHRKGTASPASEQVAKGRAKAARKPAKATSTANSTDKERLDLSRAKWLPPATRTAFRG